ncbi:hypothetical protein VNI00_017581 [Paramarasmius palmivorus]|uniref:Uncharacterized protein n=1 Tax=Paramarasmius palmivorus TaxID=297713 RepID=A0AAW0B5P7_9AGAR
MLITSNNHSPPVSSKIQGMGFVTLFIEMAEPIRSPSHNVTLGKEDKTNTARHGSVISRRGPRPCGGIAVEPNNPRRCSHDQARERKPTFSVYDLELERRMPESQEWHMITSEDEFRDYGLLSLECT